ncbi:thiamine-phosphate diphosphorylase [Fodinibius salinus]|uniref:Thiamine-phosphate synthase n=1 Tax=Fodinibius salinus TaxID=860790 RepID=A0A5D3YMI4_9BACT|nr:thiamine phosphate synthase [Fodinibius salinus]TYP93907.1 thiamine-phosphate diphosphorylase [Fodinibius salinus]
MKNSSINFRYYLITNRKAPDKRSLLETVERACKAGVRAVQLREKDMTDKSLVALGKKMRSITNEYNTRLFVNRRADIAQLLDADGVHCPENGIPPMAIKSSWPKLTVGMSVHSKKAAKRAEKEGADFLLFGPVYYTASKAKYGDPQGINKLKEVAEQFSVPVFAVGGITPEKVDPCLQAGAFGVAGISAVMKADNVVQQVNSFKEHLGQL